MILENDGGSITQKSQNELVFVPRADLTANAVGRLTSGRQVFAVTDENVARLHPEILPKNNLLVMPAGEDTKTMENAEKVCRAMLNAGMTRGCVVTAYGGGVIGDLAGFASSVYMRGVDFINVPTTLLSQVDSAIGGKTGVNLDGYKNMIGSFQMPSHIVICPEVLGSLPDREWRCGMGELVKTAALDEDLYAYVRLHIRELTMRHTLVVEKAVEAAAKFKKSVTDEDPTEQGRRMILNFGHTVGHALEKCDGHKLSHGEYVLLGMKIELAMTGDGFYKNPSFAEQMGELLAAAGMPLLPDVSDEAVCAAARADKKNGEGKIVVISLLKEGSVGLCKFSPTEFTQKYRAAVQKLSDKGELRHA